MSPSASSQPPITVLGNPGNRRTALFRAAATAAGLPLPAVIPWAEAASGRIRTDPAGWLRIDSPGEEAAVDQALRQATRPAAFGEIVGLAAAHRGMCATATAVADATGARPLNHPDDLAVLCDKRSCHAVLAAAGVPVPAALPPVDGYRRLRAAMAEAGWRRVFVKPAHGSSASGVIALATAPGGRVHAITPVAVAGSQLFNSLRVRSYQDESLIASIVDQLAADGLHVERWYPKATLGGSPVDLRVVVTAGRPTHVVARLGGSPMTNLHLGGRRGDLAACRAAAGETAWDAAMASCVLAASQFRRSIHVGVDLMFDRHWRGHAIAEVNAFGDLLPGLLVEGRDTYGEQIHALSSGRWAEWTSGRPGS